MVKHTLTFLLFSFVLAACGQATPAPTPTLTASAQPSLTVTSTITVPPIPTQTPFPTLSAEKPYFMIQQALPDDRLVVYDGSGQGRQIFLLPKVSQGGAFSPDGKWFAFYTGVLGYGDEKGELPVSLNLLNTANGTIHKVADVVPADSLQKLAELAKQLKNLYPDRYKPIDGWEWADRRITSVFQERIFSMAWSPDSQMLAFAGQIDGLSSDVYLYEVASDSVRRLNDDLESVWSIGWSPDGEKVILGNSHPGDTYTSSTLHLMKLENKVLKDPATLFSSWMMPSVDWLSPTLLLVSQGSDTGGDSHLQTLNINTGQLSADLWEKNYAINAVDPVNQTILINTHELIDKVENYGIYLLSPGKSRIKVFDGLYRLNYMIFRGGVQHRFLVSGYSDGDAQYKLDGNLVGITADNKPTVFGKFDYHQIYISPDYAWMLIYDEAHLYLYDKNDDVVKTFPIAGIQQILWRPDSQGIAYLADGKLYFLSILVGEPKLVDDCGGECLLYQDGAAWLP